ncbi:hypothetical protein D3C81_2061950 [compost metagenome]
MINHALLLIFIKRGQKRSLVQRMLLDWHNPFMNTASVVRGDDWNPQLLGGYSQPLKPAGGILLGINEADPVGAQNAGQIFLNG